MTFFDRIERIERRMEEIERRFDPPEPVIDQGHTFANVLANLTGSQHFQTPGVSPFSETTQPGGAGDYSALIEEAGRQHGVDPKLVAAVIQQESGGNPRAVSSAGAMGLMQLMPETASTLGVTDPYDPRENIFGGVRYLKGLLDRFNGNISLALAGYNAGPNAVERHGGVPPFRETQNYVASIMAIYRQNRGRL